MWVISFGNVYSQTVVEEYQLKSAFIINILSYVKWPDNSQDTSINVCIYPNNPFSDFLEKLAYLSISKRKQSIAIQYPTKIDEISSCNVIFINESSKNDLFEIQKIARNNAILTVSDIDNFSEKFGMIGFVSKNKRIELNVNLKVANNAGISLSSILLDLAKKVVRDKTS